VQYGRTKKKGDRAEGVQDWSAAIKEKKKKKKNPHQDNAPCRRFLVIAVVPGFQNYRHG